MGHSEAVAQFRELDRAESEAILARNHLGRIGYARDNRIDIQPVHYVFSEGWIYGRTSYGAKYSALAENAFQWWPVAFEVDEVEDLFHWRSVVVRGGFYVIDPDRAPPEREAWERALAMIRTLIPETLRSGDPTPFRTVLFRIAVQEVSGREAIPPGSISQAAGGEVRMERVVTAVDFHESSLEAARWAMRFLAPDAEHELLHVIDLPELPGPLRGRGSQREQRRVAARDDAQRRLDELRDFGSRPRVTSHIREGRPAAQIVRLAEEVDADLVVVGEQGPTRGVGALLGSTAERVLFDARVPVLVARKVEAAPPRRLLAAIDPAEVSHRILAWAGALLARFDGTLTILNVVDRVLLFDELTSLPTAQDFQRMQEEAVADMRVWLDDQVLAAGLPPSQVQVEVLLGDPSYEIGAEAARLEADLVLIGSKGGDIARTPMIGRIVNKVVRNAPCSVLVVTNRGQADEA